jgi:ABC-2 type transport system ATP-binding protein
MIEVRALVKSFGGRRAVDGVSFTVRRGELYALLGENGAGKSTTLALALGALAPDAGEVRIDGVVPGPGQRARAAFVPEVVELYAELDALETLELFAGIAGIRAPRPQLVLLLERAGLAREHHGRRLGVASKGMRQKVALAIAELLERSTLILDEPTSGLDPLASEQLFARLAARREQGAAILLTTHELLLAAPVVDRAGILCEGRLVEELVGPLDGAELLARYRAALARARGGRGP